MAFKLVLVHPEIPNNTGNIGRLALATGSELHLIKPYGFELSDKKLKRAGLDYWQHIRLFEYDSLEDFFEVNRNGHFIYFTKKAEKVYTDAPYTQDSFLLFGKESSGFEEELLAENVSDLYRIPIYSSYVRSLNLGNAVSIAVYEGLRKLR